jgi:DNA-binding XRE family transcriptional regulator
VEKEEFVEARTKLDKTQKDMAHLLGVSVKAIYSYEQGWRAIPTHIERQIFFLLSRKRGVNPAGC